MRIFLLLVLSLLFISGCGIMGGENQIVVGNVVGRQMVSDGYGNKVGVIVLDDFSLIGSAKSDLQKIPVVPSHYAMLISISEDGEKRLCNIEGPVEPTKIIKKKVVEKGPENNE